jgi:manganese oxidase
VKTRDIVSNAGLLAAILAGSGIATATPTQVAVQLFQFRPARLEVTAGTSVTWTNEDDIVHTVTSGVPEQRDGRVVERLAGRGAAATVEFTNPGVYPYFCERHPSMRGEIRAK